MSRHYVNSVWTDYYGTDGGPKEFVDCSEAEISFSIDTADVLSAPQVEALLPSGLALWPRGSAFGSADGEAPSHDTVIAGLTRALLSPFAALYAKAWQLTEESRAATLIDSLDEWEHEFGLPDPCVSVAQDDAARRRSLRARVRSLATITPADVVRLAASLGFVVAVEEPDAFLAGESTCGWWDEPSDVALEQQWVVHINDTPTTQFETGIGETGVDLLLDFDLGVIECALRRISPAWTLLVFSIAPLLTLQMLVTETGEAITTETGAPVMVVIAPQ